MPRKTNPVKAHNVGVIVEPFAFSDDVKDSLVKILSKRRLGLGDKVSGVLEALQGACGLWKSLDNDEPLDIEGSEIVAALENITSLASDLASAIRHADTTTSGILLDIFHFGLGAYQREELLLLLLDGLAAGAATKQRDYQGKKQAKTGKILLITFIKNALDRHETGITVSRSSGSNFRLIADQCFLALGISKGAASPIKSFMDSAAKNSGDMIGHTGAETTTVPANNVLYKPWC